MQTIINTCSALYDYAIFLHITMSLNTIITLVC